ncbi:MAG: conjugal transfer protein TraG N-terminal domain-containing protein, partial [Gammaproteobacteria bacterium]|nr:conjugal transfer protein TraG N-terminal domain-containing protein [Gammaproteobacteria bacterium]
SRVEAMTTFQPDALGAYSGREGVLGNLYGAAQDVAGAAGAGATHFSLGTMLTAIKPMLPTIQAITLMAVYALLPIIVVISGYSLSMLAVGAVGIFTINFWTVLWKFAQWVDENLTVAMHPGNLDSLMNWAAAPGGFAGATSKALMLDTMLGMLMIGMPVLWTMMMGWIGIKVGAGMRDVLSDGSAAAKRSGETGSKVATKVTTKGR